MDGQMASILSRTNYWGGGRGLDFPGGPVVKNPPSNAEDVSSVSAQGTETPDA